jgi:protein TonB
MGRLSKDLLFAVLIAVVIHAGAAFISISTSPPLIYSKEGKKGSLEIFLVSAPEKTEKKVPVKPVVKEKKVIKKKKKVPPPVETAVQKDAEVEERVEEQAQSTEETVSTAANIPSAGSSMAPKAAALLQAMPMYGENPSPTYPRIARRRGYEGTVLVSAEIFADGTVGKLLIKKTSGYAVLDREALKTIKKWKFIPASRMGVPITMLVDIPVRFSLEEDR